jgi:hypothetical protein
MSQHDQVINNGNGFAFRTDINGALAALFSCSSGGTQPAVINAGMLWFDTTLGILKVRDNTNANWLPIPIVDVTNGFVIDPASGSALLQLDKAASGQASRIFGSMQLAKRWHITLGDTSAESGANVGSDFGIARYNDAGTLQDVPLFIQRSTGNITINNGVMLIQPVSGSAQFFLNRSSGNSANVVGQTAGLNRWLMQLGNAVSETGSNVGSNFVLTRYTDAGAVIDNPIVVVRSSGVFQLTNDSPTKPTAGGFLSSSDERIKQDIRDYEAGLDEILELRPVTYRFKEGTGNDPAITRYGMVAQEVEQVMPEMVTVAPGKSGDLEFEDMRTFDPTNITYALVNAVKTLTARVEELEAQILALK